MPKVLRSVAELLRVRPDVRPDEQALDQIPKPAGGPHAAHELRHERADATRN